MLYLFTGEYSVCLAINETTFHFTITGNTILFLNILIPFFVNSHNNLSQTKYLFSIWSEYLFLIFLYSSLLFLE